MTVSEHKVKKLRPRHYQALAVLVVGGGREDAAEAAGVSLVSLRRWLRDPAFTSELSHLTGLQTQAAGRKLSSLCDRAIDALQKILDDDSTAGYVKVAAARTTLELALRWCDFISFDERLQRLEEQSVCDTNGDYSS